MMMSIRDILISEDGYSASMDGIVAPYLESRMTEGYFDGYDGNKIHYLHFAADDETAAVVISHGFTESCRKYNEVIYYFLKNGLSVYIHDQRGHGESYRSLDDLTLTHIDRFEEYVDDLELFIERVVSATPHRELCLFAHSMGGAVGALYLERHPEVFCRAILTSPMIAPYSSMPLWLGKLTTILFKAIGKGRERAFISSEYPGEEKFEDSCASCRARFEYYELKRRNTPHLQNYSPTYSWICESIGVTRKILRRSAPESIRSAVHIFSAQDENMVEKEPQRRLATRIPGAIYTEVPDSKHEIFLSSDDVVAGYMQTVIEFFAPEK